MSWFIQVAIGPARVQGLGRKVIFEGSPRVCDALVSFYSLVNFHCYMSETELKKRLITGIQRSRNSALLLEAYRLMGTDAADLEPYKLSKEQKASIAKGKKDIEEGRTLTAAKANKAIDEWLGK